MGVTINTGVTERGLNTAFRPAFRDAPTLRDKIAMLIKSDGAAETYHWLGQNPAVYEWTDKPQSKALRNYGFTLQNRDWRIDLKIDRNEEADDQTGQLADRIRDLGRRYAQGPDKLLAQLVLAGESALCYDGQYFFDTDHAEGDSGAQSNDLTYAAATGTNPTQAEFEAAFWQAVFTMVAYVDDQGEVWNHIVDFNDLSQLYVLVPPALGEVATKTLGLNAVQLANNTTNILSGKCQLRVDPLLRSWSNKFVILNTAQQERPFIFQSRMEPETFLIDNKDEKFKKYGAWGRYNVGYGLWQHAVLTTFT